MKENQLKLKQKEILFKGILTFFFICFNFYYLPSLIIFFFHLHFHILSFQDRFLFSFIWLLFPLLTLIFTILNMSLERFYSYYDIDGSLNEISKNGRIKQSILQNTLEQIVLLIIVYLLVIIYFPDDRLILIPISSILFFIGRILFFIGYNYGATGRAVGFVLTFLPTILLIFEVVFHFFFS